MPLSSHPLALAAALGLAPVAVIALPATAQAQGSDAAVAPVRALDAGLLAIMKGGAALGHKGRAAKIGPVVDQAFDLSLMTRLAVGPAWPGLAASDKTALVAAFRRMTIAQYADNFDGYSGQAFAVDPKVEARGGDRLVKTALTQPGQAPVSLAYRLRQSGGQWKIIDVFYQNSISQLATRRSDFSGILAKGGAKALIAHLDQLTAKASH